MGISNPAADHSVKLVPRQAEPFLVGDLATMLDFFHARIQARVCK